MDVNAIKAVLVVCTATGAVGGAIASSVSFVMCNTMCETALQTCASQAGYIGLGVGFVGFLVGLTRAPQIYSLSHRSSIQR